MNATAAIHVAKKQLGLDDETYRALLERVTGEASTKDMTGRQRAAVLTELRRLGFKPAEKARQTRLEGPYAKKLQWLWIAGWNLGVIRSREDVSLTAFVKGRTGLDAVRFLRYHDDAQRAVAALKAMLARGGVDWSKGAAQPDWFAYDGARIATAQWAVLAKAKQVDATFQAFAARVARITGIALRDMRADDWAAVMNLFGATIRSLDVPKTRVPPKRSAA